MRGVVLLGVIAVLTVGCSWGGASSDPYDRPLFQVVEADDLVAASGAPGEVDEQRRLCDVGSGGNDEVFITLRWADGHTTDAVTQSLVEAATVAGWAVTREPDGEVDFWQLQKGLVRTPALLTITSIDGSALSLTFQHYGPGC